MFKKMFAWLLCVCILVFGAVGCTQKQSEQKESKTQVVTLYLPNEQAEYVEQTESEITITEDDIAGALVAALVKEGALPEGVSVNKFSKDEDMLTLDFNQAFADAVMSSGTAGETMLMASVVDTFLAYYGAASLTITVEGQPVETGHTIYDEPFTQIFSAAPVK